MTKKKTFFFVRFLFKQKDVENIKKPLTSIDSLVASSHHNIIINKCFAV